MSKKQMESKARRGPTVRQVGAAIAKNHPTVAELASRTAQGLVMSAMALGQHRARAELLAPIIEDMAKVEARQADGHLHRVVLTQSACRIVLACLAEAGYVPPPEGGEGFAFAKAADTTNGCDARQAWSGVLGDGAEAPKAQPFPVAKAA